MRYRARCFDILLLGRRGRTCAVRSSASTLGAVDYAAGGGAPFRYIRDNLMHTWDEIFSPSAAAAAVRNIAAASPPLPPPTGVVNPNECKTTPAKFPLSRPPPALPFLSFARRPARRIVLFVNSCQRWKRRSSGCERESYSAAKKASREEGGEQFDIQPASKQKQAERERDRLIRRRIFRPRADGL